VNFKEIGWNGFLLKVPEEIYLTRQGGDAKRGSLSLESEGYMIEIKWEPIPKEPEPLETIVESLIKQVEKSVKKANQNLEVRERRKSRIRNHAAIYLHLKSALEERYYVWYCEESDRIIISRFVCKTFDEKSRNLMKQFLSTIKCHSDEKNIWALMKVRFESPQSFLLKEAEIKVGKMRIILEENKVLKFRMMTRRIIVEYFSAANLVFKDTYKDPEKWFEKNYLSDLKKILRKGRIKFETSRKKKLENHKVIIKRAEKSTYGFSSASKNLFSTAIWYCPEMNRMYSVTVASSIAGPLLIKKELSKKEHEKIFRELLDSFKCHQTVTPPVKTKPKSKS